MNKYTFKIELTGFGDNADQAWEDATMCTMLEDDPTPDEYEMEEMNNEDDDQ